jgi:hypothetical protein
MRIIFFYCLVFILASCSSNKSNPGPPVVPQAAILTLPEQNAICVSGNVISVTQSSIQFNWQAAANTDNYVVSAKNLLTGDSVSVSSTQPQATITLTRNTPYSWYVISKTNTNSNTAKSVVWKFYNSGDGVTSYAPFPADNLNPATGQYVTVPASGTITLIWVGSAVQNNIVGYDVYFGTSLSPPLYQKSVTESSVNNVPVTAATAYYWKVVTHDSNNNTSTSDVVQFNTN